MVFNKTWREDYPQGKTHSMNVVDNAIRNNQEATRERAEVDHNAFADESGESNLWYHKKVSLINQATNPTTYAAGGVFFTKAGNLYFINSSGDVIQITSGDGFAVEGKDNITRGLGITWKSVSDLYVEPGTLFHGATRVNKTARTTLTPATNSDWIDGSKPASLNSIHIYIYVKSDGTIKLEETAPAYADTAGNTVGKKIYHLEGSVYWRWIGSVRTEASGNILRSSNTGDWTSYSSIPGEVTNGTVNAWTTLTCADIPTTSFLAKFMCYTAGNDFRLRPVGSIQDTHTRRINTSYGILECSLNSLQQLQYYITNSANRLQVSEYYNPRN